MSTDFSRIYTPDDAIELLGFFHASDGTQME